MVWTLPEQKFQKITIVFLFLFKMQFIGSNMKKTIICKPNPHSMFNIVITMYTTSYPKWIIFYLSPNKMPPLLARKKWVRHHTPCLTLSLLLTPLFTPKQLFVSRMVATLLEQKNPDLWWFFCFNSLWSESNIKKNCYF